MKAGGTLRGSTLGRKGRHRDCKSGADIVDRSFAARRVAGSRRPFEPVAVVASIGSQILGLAGKGTITHDLIPTAAVHFRTHLPENPEFRSSVMPRSWGLPPMCRRYHPPENHPSSRPSALVLGRRNVRTRRRRHRDPDDNRIRIGILITRPSGAAAATLSLLIIVYGIVAGARDVKRGSQALIGVQKTVNLTLVVASPHPRRLPSRPATCRTSKLLWRHERPQDLELRSVFALCCIAA